MFNLLTHRFSKILEKISNKGIITEKNIKNSLREVQKSFLEADVALPVVKKFIHNIKSNVLGKKINKSLTPGQEFVKIIKNELISKLGDNKKPLNFSVSPPAIFLFVGAQGVGKTTSVAKIGKLIREQYKKKILIVTTDIHRPAAIKQLKLLSIQAKIDFISPKKNSNTTDIAIYATKYATNHFYDVLLIDTSGRLHTNKQLMLELYNMQKCINPAETLLVVDAISGQDSINVINSFNKFINLTGIILTKLDSDARGGIALSVKELTNKSIKFIGNGETLEAIDTFNSKKIANRILGMEDVLSTIEEITKKIKIPKNNTLKTKKNFDLNDFLLHVNQIRKTGGIYNLLQKLPINKFTHNLSNTINETELTNFSAIINSMTPKERRIPKIIKNSRKRRISLGSGLSIQKINKLLKQFELTKNIMKKIKKNGLMQSIKTLIQKKF